MSGATRTWVVRAMTPDDEPDVRDLLAQSMGDGPTGERTSEFFTWKHRDNVFGESPGILAVDGDRVVGVRLFLRWELRWGDRTLRAVRAVDTATHPDYGRQGIFKTLTRELLQRLEREGEVDLVFNTPNASSRPGYLKMGWQPVGDLGLHLGTRRPLRLLRGLRAARQASAGGSSDDYAAVSSGLARPVELPPTDVLWSDGPAVAELLAEMPPSAGLHTPRSVEYLRWRYSAPGLDYRCVPIRQGDRLTALAVGRVRTRGGLTEFTLGELLGRPGDTDQMARALRTVATSGVDHVVLHAGARHVRRAAMRAAFVPAPGVGIALVANPRVELSSAVFEPASWELSLGDVEVF